MLSDSCLPLRFHTLEDAHWQAAHVQLLYVRQTSCFPKRGSHFLTVGYCLMRARVFGCRSGGTLFLPLPPPFFGWFHPYRVFHYLWLLVCPQWLPCFLLCRDIPGSTHQPLDSHLEPIISPNSLGSSGWVSETQVAGFAGFAGQCFQGVLIHRPKKSYMKTRNIPEVSLDHPDQMKAAGFPLTK